MKANILLLEDDLQLSQTVEQFLKMHGFNVYTAYDGFSAQDIIYEKNIDLMLLDVKVPNINGFEFLKQERDSGSNTPAIFITSLNSINDLEKGFSVGADDYIRKPFALKELLVRVEAQLKKLYNSSSNKVLIEDGLEFDFNSMRLFKDGKEINLKNKELKLLALFLKNKDILLEYDKIFQEIWDYDKEPSSGSLRAYIKTLRSVIGKDKIQTIKNIGYRFVS
jgi:DNA-binding response OmpR family regulator